MLHHTFLSL